MTLESLLLSGILRGSGCGECASAYAGDITAIVTKMEQLQREGERIKVYESVAGKTVSLKIGT